MAKKYKPSKNKKKHIVKKMQETEGLNTGFGEYKEATGGGTPFEKGNSNTRTSRENGKKRQADNPTTNQPRDNGGRFTYKSVNGQSIDPKYGPSRGKTVPPTLTGGNEDGVVYIKDVEKQFSVQSGTYWDKYKDKWYQVGGKIVTEGLSTKVSGEAVWNQAKEYDESLGEYKGESENWKTKTGRKSAAEKEAQQKVKETGEQQNVINKETGGIETVGLKKKIEKFVESKKEPEKEMEKEMESVQVPEGALEPEEKINPEDQEPWGKTGKITKGQVKKAKENIKAKLGSEFDETFWDDDTLEEFIGNLSEKDLQELIA